MEKIIWVNSHTGLKADDGLMEVNDYLADGWRVKLISAAAMGTSVNYGQAYIVIVRD